MNDELKHHGIKGMKWGVRRTKAQLGYKTSSGAKSKTSSGSTSSATSSKKTGSKLSAIRSKGKDVRQRRRDKKEAEERAKQAKKSAKKRKPISEMSDDELRQQINRLQLEKQYRELAATSQASKKSKGRKFVENVVEKSGENLTVQVLNHYGSKGLNKLIGEEVIYANNKKKS